MPRIPNSQIYNAVRYVWGVAWKILSIAKVWKIEQNSLKKVAKLVKLLLGNGVYHIYLTV